MNNYTEKEIKEKIVSISSEFSTKLFNLGMQAGGRLSIESLIKAFNHKDTKDSFDLIMFNQTAKALLKQILKETGEIK